MFNIYEISYVCNDYQKTNQISYKVLLTNIDIILYLI